MCVFDVVSSGMALRLRVEFPDDPMMWVSPETIHFADLTQVVCAPVSDDPSPLNRLCPQRVANS